MSQGWSLLSVVLGQGRRWGTCVNSGLGLARIGGGVGGWVSSELGVGWGVGLGRDWGLGCGRWVRLGLGVGLWVLS